MQDQALGEPVPEGRATLWGVLFVIAAFTILVVSITWLAALNEIRHDRESTDSVSRQQAADLVRAFEARLIDRMERINHALVEMGDELSWELSAQELMTAARMPMRGRLSGLVHGIPQDGLIEVSIMDSSGLLVDSTLPERESEHRHGWEPFRVHRNRPAGIREERTFIAKPEFLPGPQRWSLTFTRRVNGPDGEFAGVLAFSYDPVLFTRLAGDLPIGEKGSVSIIGNDRVLRMLHTQRVDPLRRQWIGRELPADRPYFDPDRPAADVVPIVSAIDQSRMLGAFRRMTHCPLIVAVHLSQEEIFAPVDERARFLIKTTGLFTGILVLFTSGLAALVLHLHRTRAALGTANRRLRENELELEQRVAERTDALERSNEHVQRLAYHDTLTGLPNRALFADRAAHALHCAAADGRGLAMLFLDLDHFKMVNDTLGHRTGDELLVEVAGRLRGAIRPSDTVARMGGDEFVILAEGLAGTREAANEAAHRAERILEELSRPMLLDGHTLHVSGSVGIAVYPDDGTDAASLLKNADTAMYAAKQAGRNTMRFFSPSMTRAAEQRLALEHALRKAIDAGELSLVYQPKVSVATGALCGVEALVRWRHPERGWIPPVEFIPVAEETGLIEPLGAWVLEEACRTIAGWDAARLGPLHVAVNVAAAQVNRGDLTGLINSLTRRHRIDPTLLEAEITETAVIGDTARAFTTLNSLRSLGVSVALDDFGTGYSSLIYLRRLDIDTIKIDRSFLGDAQSGSRDAEIIRQMIKLAKTLQLSVVAEGVETADQVAFLKDAGCDIMQGYHIARPMPLADLRAWVAARRPAPTVPERPALLAAS
ncbi:EAL domain-containing protein [Azospirillum sp. SYSU D00513]|uniref:bifunctional diguanylate cyclase/phosphodiesterase n=1 Tax=Azospirillum sp. SYSU D00513 TaxID=2812561 RepID=UPI001A9604F5|nr:EAL domain-containing protein [Azospirillum sp. SYSU D00513]